MVFSKLTRWTTFLWVPPGWAGTAALIHIVVRLPSRFHIPMCMANATSGAPWAKDSLSFAMSVFP